jgi:hypothetical protein
MSPAYRQNCLQSPTSAHQATLLVAEPVTKVLKRRVPIGGRRWLGAQNDRHVAARLLR